MKMPNYRRLYIYLVATVSWLALLAGSLVSSHFLARGLAEGMGLAATLARLGGPAGLGLLVAIIALPIWATHWYLAERAGRPLTMAGAQERASAARKAHLYIGQAAAVAAMSVQAGFLLYDLLLRILGGPVSPNRPWPGWPQALAVGGALSLLFWAYLRWCTVRDGDFGQEAAGAAAVRRSYFYLLAGLGFATLAAGAGEFVRALAWVWTSVPFPAAWQIIFARSVASGVLGMAVGLSAWNRANALAYQAPEAELHTLGRKLLIFGGALAGAVAALASLAYLLRHLFLVMFGLPLSAGQAGWGGLLGIAVAALPVGAAYWIGFGLASQDDIAEAEETPAAAAARRLYRYALAAACLTAFWFGMTELLRLAAAGLTGQGAAGAPAADAAARFSTAAALLLVAAPAWWAHWWSQQTRARRDDPAGASERASPIRKVYLYAFLAAAVLVSLLALALAIYRMAGGRFGLSWAEALAVMAAAAGWWLAHALVLRGDRRLAAHDGLAQTAEQPPQPVADQTAPRVAVYDRTELASLANAALGRTSSPRQPALVVAVVDGGDGRLGAALLAGLRTALPAAALWPIGLNAAAQIAMLDALGAETPPAVPADALSRVAAIVGPADILAPGGLDGDAPPELAAALAASPAQKFLLPPHDSRLRWVAAPDWPLELWVEYAVAEMAEYLRDK
jgi:hypothetical protein